MTWAKIDDGFLDHPKALRAGEDAANLYLRALVWCNRHLTDGEIPREALKAITGRRDAKQLASRLVQVNLWETTANGWAVHDFADHNPSRASVLAARDVISAKRSEAGRRGGKASGMARSAKQTGSKHEANGEAIASGLLKQNEAPSRPVPKEVSYETSVASAAPRSDDPVVVPTPTAETPSAALAQQPHSGQSALAAFLGGAPANEPPAPKAKTPRKAKAPATPPPFDMAEAFEALASTAFGRFAPGEQRDWTAGHRIAVAKAIRAYPTIAEWEALGTWLAAGGDKHRGTLSVAWAASSGFADAMARARDWHAKGRPAMDGRPVATAVEVKANIDRTVPPPTDPKKPYNPSGFSREKQLRPENMGPLPFPIRARIA